MVTSGKSPRSAASTSPMVSRGAASSGSRRRAAAGLIVRRPSRASAGWPGGSLSAGLAGARSGQVDQAELANLDLAPAGQRGDVDRLAVDVGAVEAADV